MKTDANGNRVSYHGDATADQPMTAHFVWNPGYLGEEPPKNAIVYQLATARYIDSGNQGGHGQCSTTLPHEVDAPTYAGGSPYGPPPKIIGHVKTGRKYFVRADPGYTFDESLTPTAHVEGDGIVGPPDVQGTGMASVSYFAQATPVFIATSSLHNNTSILIGQKFNAYLETGTYEQNNWEWVAPDEDSVFQRYSGGDLLKGCGYISGRGVKWYWNKDGSYHIACSADVITITGEILHVTADKDVTVQAPYYYYGSIAGNSVYVKGNKVVGGNDPAPDDNPDIVRAGRDVNTDPGMHFEASVGTPDLYRDEGTGSFQFVQLVNLTKQGYPTHWQAPTTLSTYGTFQLDNIEPYAGPFPAGAIEGDPPTPNLPNPQFLEKAEDSPDFGIDTYVKFHIDFEANMYLMYLPPGEYSQWVPLHKHVWNWNADASRANLGQGWSPATLGPVTNGSNVRCYVHPQWTSVWNNRGN